MRTLTVRLCSQGRELTVGILAVMVLGGSRRLIVEVVPTRLVVNVADTIRDGRVMEMNGREGVDVNHAANSWDLYSCAQDVQNALCGRLDHRLSILEMVSMHEGQSQAYLVEVIEGTRRVEKANTAFGCIIVDVRGRLVGNDCPGDLCLRPLGIPGIRASLRARRGTHFVAGTTKLEGNVRSDNARGASDKYKTAWTAGGELVGVDGATGAGKRLDGHSVKGSDCCESGGT